jgi:hypothetical protein
VRVGDRVLTSKGFYPVTNFFIQGEQSLCRIQTQDGSFECTADHKVAVFTDVYGNYKMVKAQDLQSGDRLIFVPQTIPGTPTELPEFRGKVEGKTKKITVPALTPDVAYFIGYLHGDGSVSSDELNKILTTTKAVLIHQLAGVGALTRIPEMLIAGVPVIANGNACRSSFEYDGIYHYEDQTELKEMLSKSEFPFPQMLPRPRCAEERFIKTLRELSSIN